MTSTNVTCSCCGQERPAADVARLQCHPDVAVCGACVHYLAGELARRPSITPILPVHDMDVAEAFWSRTGLEVERYDDGYAFVRHEDGELVHLAHRPDLDVVGNAAACYVHVADPGEWRQRLLSLGVAVTEMRTEPWGMLEFSLRDPSGNLLRVGCPA